MSLIPDEYKIASDEELSERIKQRKKSLGESLLILTHHYQRAEIVGLGDRVGDSYGLSKLAAKAGKARYIVFCGVRFMAEAARILCRSDQSVYLPNPTAGCPMADMAPLEQIDEAWQRIHETQGFTSIIPISYMNSSTDLKAFTGKHGGLICTSSNAIEAFKWAFARAKKLFFFPDQHLGRNTVNKMSITADQVVVYNPAAPDGGVTDAELDRARVILWNGYCYVHAKFKLRHIDEWRARDTSVQVVVHPECNEEVVNTADAVGSTSFIVDFVKNAPAGSTIAIGTELNLVHRLAITHKDKNIFELSGDSCPLCSNMFRTSLADLCYTLENLETSQQIIVPNEILADAKISLGRMLEISG